MKVIATDIANLTDARYFAAWGVDGLSYNIDPSSDNSLSSAQLKEIVEWVEGPSTIVKLDGLEVPENFVELKSIVDIQNIIIGPFIDSKNLLDFEKVYRICTVEDGWQEGNYLILSFPFEIGKITALQEEKIRGITNDKEVFLDANFSPSDLETITNLGFTGIILKGGEEEKVGFKSYDELDEILEAIYD
jgi:phosphoribosylanthranilate isomerase